MTFMVSWLQDSFIQKSILMGLAFGMLNFWLLSQVVSGFILSQQDEASQEPHLKQKRLVRTITLLIGKMILLFLTIGLILWKQHATPLAFLGGFTISLLISIPLKLLQKGPDHA